MHSTFGKRMVVSDGVAGIGCYLDGRRRVLLVLRLAGDGVGWDGEAVLLVVQCGRIARLREIEEVISSCPELKMGMDRVTV